MKISSVQIQNSIILDGTVIDCRERIVDSIIGKNSRITAGKTQSTGRTFVVGDNTFLMF